MSDVVLKLPKAHLDRRPAGPDRRSPSSIRAGRMLFWLACAWLVLVVLAAAGADLLPLRPYDVPVAGLRPRTAPLHGLPELLGTDALGRSMVSRLVFGARQSLLVGAAAVTAAMLVGLVLGMVAGYLRGVADTVLRVLLDTQLAIPPLVLLLAIAASGRRTVWTVVIGLSIVGIPTFARLARAQTLAVVNLDYVVAARAMGAGHLRVLVRELLPGVVVSLLTYAFLHMGLVIVAEGSLSFLGLGIPPPSPSWGGMVNDGRRYLSTEPFLVFVPAACLVLTVLSFTIIGDRARRLFDTPGGGALVNHSADRPLLSVDGLTTRLPTPHGMLHAVDGVSFVLGHGESLGVVGESGSGKSMLCRSVLRLAPASAQLGGAVRFDGVDLMGLPMRAMRSIRGARLALVLQNPKTALNPVIRVGRQVAEPLRVHSGLDRATARSRAIELLRRVGLPDPVRQLRAYPHELSGGMRQRVCLAIAISCAPALLLADEPTTALDVTVQRQILDLIADLQRQHAMALVLVSHDIGVVAHRTDRVLVMYGGRVVETGPTRLVFAVPRHPYTAALLASVPRLRQRSHTPLAEIPGRPVDAVDPTPGCRFAPRCARAQARCLREDPVLAHDGVRAAACFFPVGTRDGERARAANVASGRTAAGLLLAGQED